MRPASEPRLTIAPDFRAIIPSRTARVQLIMPQRFSWISRSHSSRVFSTKSRSIVQPTLFTSTSTRPQRASTSFTSAWTESHCVTSVRTAAADAAPRACASPATFFACASSMSAIVTCARSPANARLRARPMLDAPPVTITLLPARFNSIVGLLSRRALALYCRGLPRVTGRSRLGGYHLPDRRRDPPGVGQHRVLERRRERHRHPGIAESARRRLQRSERVLGDKSEDLALDA